MSREYFINNVANWLPEDSHVSLYLLRKESEGEIGFWQENENLCVIKTVATDKVVFKVEFK
jgi:hypothetical protein